MFLTKKLGMLFLCIGLAAGFCSCKSEIKITAKKDSCAINYKTVLGAALWDTVSALSGGGEVLFDTAQFEEVFAESNLEKVRAVSETKDSLDLSAELSKDKSDFINLSEMLEISQNGNSMVLTFSEKNLSALYENMPQVMQSYIDMFMAPSFTGEKMTDEEYLELVSSVYGDVVSEEIKKSVVNFTLVNVRGKSSSYSVRLLEIINLKKELVFKN
ncbi:MAG: hypothetical protein II367_03540 [Treponema sp.]|nr:hypothetical protein [Treponema sp.]